MLASSVPATQGFGSCREKRDSVVLLDKSNVIIPGFQKCRYKQHQFTSIDDQKNNNYYSSWLIVFMNLMQYCKIATEPSASNCNSHV